MKCSRIIAPLAVVATALAFAAPASAASVYGTGGNDYLEGGWGNDLIVGYSGHDRMFGSWGDDTMNGGYGDDYVNGGPGNDVINGGYGNDELATGYDNVVDTVHCGPGWDVVYLRRGDRFDFCEIVHRLSY